MSDNLSVLKAAGTESSISRSERSMHPSLTDHSEKHKGHGDLVRDSIIGFSDGLTVPFALTAGLSSLGSSRIVIIGGLAELFAGALSMGVGAFLASITDRKHYEVEEARERREVLEKPEAEEAEIYEIFAQYGIDSSASKGVVEALKVNEDMWVKFMMDFELQLTNPSYAHSCVEGLVMGLSYFLGGLLPLIPYFIFQKNVNDALFTSIGVTAFILLVFGYVKSKLAGTNAKDAFYGAIQTLILGSLAAGVAYGVVKAVNAGEHVHE